jgi:pre-60S factor REI1
MSKGSSSLVALCALKERERQEFVRGLACMFCKEVLDGKRAVLFDHLWEVHHFFAGSCDNLVHIDEFVALLHKKLHVDKQCLKCVKQFGTYDQLRLHMRKKKHCDIAGNKEFDK